MSHIPQIFLIDADPAGRELLSRQLATEGFGVTDFTDGATLVSAAREVQPACIVLDVSPSGPCGLEVLKALKAAHHPSPVVVMSGQGSIPMAVDAIKSGATDFIEKPCDTGQVVSRLKEAIADCQQRGKSRSRLAATFPGMELLTPREREVLEQIAGGSSNKEAGRLLGISPRTVEVHRARIMEKLNAKNAADLVRIVLTDHSLS